MLSTLLVFLGGFFLLENALVIHSLPDVYFLPGYGGSSLYATVTADEYLPSTCNGAGIPINQPIMVWWNETLMDHYPECLADILQQSFRRIGAEDFVFEDTKGIKITTYDFGGVGGLDANTKPFFDHLVSWGYEIGKNAFGVPYDFRYGSVPALNRIGFISEFQALVEKNFANTQSKAIVLGHSNGGPTLYSLIAGLSNEWKEKYIAGIIPLSGNMLGQLNCYSSYFYSTNTQYQRMETSWEASFLSLPWGDYSGLNNVTVITTYSSTKQQTKYSPKLSDIQSLFHSVFHDDWSEKLEVLYKSAMNRSASPMAIDIYCLYGSRLPTSYSFIFKASILDAPPVETLYMNGDDNQDSYDNEFCKTWANQPDFLSQSPKKIFQSKEFPGVHHMEMISDEKVMNEIWRILQTY